MLVEVEVNSVVRVMVKSVSMMVSVKEKVNGRVVEMRVVVVKKLD